MPGVSRHGGEAGLAHAERAFRRAAESHRPEVAGPALLNLGLLLETQGQLAEAQAAYRGAGERNQAEGFARAAHLLMQAGDTHAAHDAWARAEALGSVEASYSLGLIAAESHDVALAERYWRQAAELGHAESAHALGMLLREQGDFEGARAAWVQAAERGYPELSTGRYRRGAPHRPRRARSRRRRTMADTDLKGERYLLQFADREPVIVELEEHVRSMDTVGSLRGQPRTTTSRRLEDSLRTILPAATALMESLRELPGVPEEVELRFGVRFTAEGDAVLTLSNGESHFDITLRWGREAVRVDAVRMVE
jgi:tetratricopeptide (TPR) repeat protein